MRALVLAVTAALLAATVGAAEGTVRNEERPYYAGEFAASCVERDTTCFPIAAGGWIDVDIHEDALGLPGVVGAVAAYVHFRHGEATDTSYGALADNGDCDRQLPYWTNPQQSKPGCRGGEHYICDASEYNMPGLDDAATVAYITLLNQAEAALTCGDRVPVWDAPLPFLLGPTDGSVTARIFTPTPTPA